jgi:L-ascorbate metabolism protein UlaG (beta-lactamase superfamily)
MQCNTHIQLLGIGAIKITNNQQAIYIDAFNCFNEAPRINENDIILFTHNDSDHFLCEKMKGKILNNSVIIGPPSIAYPIFESNLMNAKNVKIYYPTNYSEPQQYKDNGLTINIYNTEHFIGWHNVHVSYLIEIGNNRIYITGDSKIRSENEKELENIDCIIYSLLNEYIEKSKIERKYGKYFHIWELLELKARLKPKKIIGNHMINCDWSINPDDLRRLIVSDNIEDIIIPVSNEEVIII